MHLKLQLNCAVFQLTILTDTKHRAASFRHQSYLYAEIWRYIDFQNGGRPPYQNCFTTIRDHSRSLCCWPQLSVKFHVNLIHRSEDIAVCIFRIFGLKFLFRLIAQNGGFGDFVPLNVIIHHRVPQKAHPCVNLRLLSQAINCKNLLRGLGELTESVTDTFIFCPCIALDRQKT